MDKLIKRLSKLDYSNDDYNLIHLSEKERDIFLTALTISKNLPLLYKSLEDELEQLNRTLKLNCKGRDQYIIAYEDCKKAIESLIALSIPKDIDYEEEYEKED